MDTPPRPSEAAFDDTQHPLGDGQTPPPTRRRTGLIETRSIDYIPLSERHGKVWHLFPVWFTGGAQLASVATGVIGVSMGANLVWSMIAIVSGCAFGTFFMAFHSTQGPQLGLPQMIQSRPQFGYMGALLVWFVALISYVGFNVFNQVLAGQAMQVVAHVPTTVSYIIFTLLALLVAIAGYDWIHRAQRWLAYPIVLGLLIATVGALIQVRLPASQFDLTSFHTTPFLAQFIAAAAYQLSWAIYVSDYSRYLPPTVRIRSTFWSTYIGTLLGGAWVMILGATAASLNKQLEVVPALRALGDHVFLGFGAVLLIATLPGLVTISSLNFYGASLTLLSVRDSIKPFRPTRRARITVLVGIAAIAFVLTLSATGNFLDNFSSFLALLFYLLTPWTAINLIDFYVVRKTHYSVHEIFNPRGIYGRWSWRGMLAYGLSFAAMVPFFSMSWFTGPVANALNGMDLSVFIGLPVAAGVYLIACISLDTEKEAQQARAADATMTL